ncbi:DUF4350 domain-containing protein [Streptomyces sp. NPDC051211]|uniref:DUF4350 domain-containing protein n=1 Tax=Streptomyces sp. NPDC051211 TaxID=3154643 RepID=UPI00344C56BF
MTGPDRHEAQPRPAAPAEPRTSTALDAAALWRRARGFLLFLAVLLAAGIVLAAFDSGRQHAALDPRSADPLGSRALAQLLDERGVTTRVVTSTQEAADAAGPDTTLLVTDPGLLGPAQQHTLRTAIDLSGGRTVLLGPRGSTARALAPGVESRAATGDELRAPDCALPAAVSAGRAQTGGDVRYTTANPEATGCYPDGGRPTLLVLPATAGGDTVLLGNSALLHNENLAEQGNASLALHLLGSRPHLVWYLPSVAELAESGGAEDKSLLELVPAGWGWALLQLALAAVLAALWRARRLGPLVTEHLPVVVRASEATEGRARLYRKAGARDRAATVLRAAARERLAALVGVPAAGAHDPGVLLPAVSAAAGPAQPQPPARDLTHLLFGPTPADDAALVALADHLDALEREVRTS